MIGGGDIALAGTGPLPADAHFHLALNGLLPSGSYTLLASILDGNAVATEIRRIPYSVPEPKRPSGEGRQPAGHQLLLPLPWQPKGPLSPACHFASKPQ